MQNETIGIYSYALAVNKNHTFVLIGHPFNQLDSLFDICGFILKSSLQIFYSF